MAEYVRVSDDVKPRREYSVRASQVTDAHRVLKKPGAYADGTPIPPKYAPPKMSASSEAAKKEPTTSGNQAADSKE